MIAYIFLVIGVFMKLSEFKNKETDGIKQTEQKQTNESSNKSVEEMYNNYKNMNSTQLMQELFSQVNMQKQNGTFNFDKLNESINQVLPYLGEEQKNNLLSILNSLK